MRIDIIGGGPAGLYAALLLKKDDPARTVRVFERNPADQTFGWGVVFSDRTLGHLAETEPGTREALEQGLQTWEKVIVSHRGERIAVGGNRFSGIGRLRLLQVLQRRAAALGVELHFGHQVDDLAPHLDADVLIGADGVGSRVRTALAHLFEPEIDVREYRYIWYGTPQPFDGLTLSFRETEWGVFTAHSYRFSPELSTFIIECGPQTFERAGFSSMPEPEARSRLERIFVEELGGAPLLSNRSRWTRFRFVRNRRWHAGRFVLLGDALHTAHFSIGSGTKLAMESAIALAEALRGCSSREAPQALAAFEAARRPAVERFQQAALESMRWFEAPERFMHLEPIAFAYACMTRTSRVDRENLRARDPSFVARYEREVEGKTEAAEQSASEPA